eukprot:1693640-Rhodomonas_salina.2
MVTLARMSKSDPFRRNGSRVTVTYLTHVGRPGELAICLHACQQHDAWPSHRIFCLQPAWDGRIPDLSPVAIPLRCVFSCASTASRQYAIRNQVSIQWPCREDSGSLGSG